MTSPLIVAPEEDGYERTVAEIRERCSDPSIGEDEAWAYIYGVMHAPDWRERFSAELETSAPRFPLPENGETFAVFRAAGELMELHSDYDRAPESTVPQLEITRDEGDEGDELRIPRQGMRWERVKGEDGKWGDDLTRLNISEAASLTHIPPEAHACRVAGASPLEWAVKELTWDEGWEGEDPNRDPRWKDDPCELVSHLRKLAYVGVRTAQIVANLPPSLGDTDRKDNDERDDRGGTGGDRPERPPLHSRGHARRRQTKPRGGAPPGARGDDGALRGGPGPHPEGGRNRRRRGGGLRHRPLPPRGSGLGRC